MGGVELRDLDLRLQGQTFYCYAFIKKRAGRGYPRQICLNSHGPAVVLLLLFLLDDPVEETRR